jgi:hypothetical protein
MSPSLGCRVNPLVRFASLIPVPCNSVGGVGRVAEVSWPVEQLVVAARDGDVESIAALVSGAHPHVQRFAYSMCASPEDAEDAAQSRPFRWAGCGAPALMAGAN